MLVDSFFYYICSDEKNYDKRMVVALKTRKIVVR